MIDYASVAADLVLRFLVVVELLDEPGRQRALANLAHALGDEAEEALLDAARAYITQTGGTV